jgi:uncharacterized protein with FMN-binding domain
MRRIVVAVVSTVSGLIMLFAYHTSRLGPGGSTTALAGTSGGLTDPTTSAPDPTPTPTATAGQRQRNGSTTAASPAGVSGTFTGDVANTQWGPVQVQLTVVGGKITKSEAVQHPQGTFRDEQINSYALPILSQEVVDRQSGNIDAISGATITSEGYYQSLQSALDRANL